MVDLTKILNNPAAAAVNNIIGITDNITDIVNTYIVTPEGNKDMGINGFIFDNKGEEIFECSSDITDHFIENNTTLQDHIALKPEIITVRGYVGELSSIPPAKLADIQKQTDKLKTLSPYIPEITTQAAAVYNQIERGYKVYEKANDTAWDYFSPFDESVGSMGLNKQAKAFFFFYVYWQKRAIFNVQTPYALIPNMVISTMRVRQDETTKMISDFEIVFKKLNIAETIVLKSQKIRGRAKKQLAKKIDKGVQKPPAVSMLKQYAGQGAKFLQDKLNWQGNLSGGAGNANT